LRRFSEDFENNVKGSTHKQVLQLTYSSLGIPLLFLPLAVYISRIRENKKEVAGGVLRHSLCHYLLLPIPTAVTSATAAIITIVPPFLIPAYQPACLTLSFFLIVDVMYYMINTLL
jgi:hypothetical protein